MTYEELPTQWKKAARELVKFSLDAWEREMAEEEGRKPIFYSMRSYLFKDTLKNSQFKIIVDEVTKDEKIDYLY